MRSNAAKSSLCTRLYAATTNSGKLAEFAASARDFDSLDVLPLPRMARMAEPVESATTFMGNAEIKARAYSLAEPGELVLADDSGLEVDALGGQPGVRSARFADDLGFQGGLGPGFGLDSGPTLDERNNRAVLSLLAEMPPVRDGVSTRAARFVCALAVARDGEILLRARGEVEGELLDAPRGEDGFGYDPLFLVPSVGLTMAELPRAQKWSLSHRGNAFRSLMTQMQRMKL